MMKPTLAGLGLIAALVFAPMAAADKLNDRDSTARTEMNALGDKALAGDEAALWTLKATANECRATRLPGLFAGHVAGGGCGGQSWLAVLDQGRFRAEQKAEGMRFYAQAARLGRPAGFSRWPIACATNACRPISRLRPSVNYTPERSQNPGMATNIPASRRPRPCLAGRPGMA